MGDNAWRWRGGTYQVVVVVGLCTREMRGGEGCWAKTQNRAIVARFMAHCVQQRWGMVCEGGAVAHTKWQWLWGCGFTKREARRGAWAETRNRAVMAWLRVRHAEQQWGWGWHGGTYQVVMGGGWCTHEMQGRKGAWAET
jgi:hypothetical protein